MAVLNWPTALPQSPQKGFTETVGASIIRSQTDKGPAKQRYRGKSPNTMSLEFIMTTNQVTTLESFVNNSPSEIPAGIKTVGRFNFTHPRTSSSVEVRIVPQGDGQLFSYQYLAPGYWNVSVTFEIMP
jgi:hypothetical protein